MLLKILSVLAMKRAFYDKFGEEKLKEGFYSDGSKIQINLLNLQRTEWWLSFRWKPRRNF